MDRNNRDITLTKWLLFWVFLTIFMFVGYPDLLDALINRIGGWK